jgi:hypothetical protein
MNVVNKIVVVEIKNPCEVVEKMVECEVVVEVVPSSVFCVNSTHFSHKQHATATQQR